MKAGHLKGIGEDSTRGTYLARAVSPAVKCGLFKEETHADRKHVGEVQIIVLRTFCAFSRGFKLLQNAPKKLNVK